MVSQFYDKLLTQNGIRLEKFKRKARTLNKSVEVLGCLGTPHAVGVAKYSMSPKQLSFSTTRLMTNCSCDILVVRDTSVEVDYPSALTCYISVKL